VWIEQGGISARETSAAADFGGGGRERWGVEIDGRGRVELRESGYGRGVFPPCEKSKRGSSAIKAA
jgi:hypothetical protein